MKAIRVNGWGQPVQMEDIPQPEPASDEVLVRVHAASINPFDTFIHAGYLQGMVNIPLTLGTDFAGEVVETGADIQHVKPGDAVYGLVPLHPGSFSEYLVAKAYEVAHKPKTLNYIEAAGVPLAALAAYQSLFELGQAQKGQRVLIIGAGGAVGACAVQLALDLGAEVYAVDLPDRADFIRALGAAHFIDAQSQRYEDAAGGVDLVLDYVGGENFERSLNVLHSGGRYVTSLVIQAPSAEAERRGIQAIGLGTQARAEQLDDLAQRIDAGRLKIFINSTFPLHETQAAMDHRMKTTNPGKVVLKIV